MKQNKESDGFTLVELAIVLVIVGLLVAGILKGSEMIHNAQMQETISQYESFLGAHHSFKQIYGSIPGDMVNATNRLVGCNAGNNCANGDGNGILGNRLGNGGGATTGSAENALYWKHMALSELIGGINKSASILPGDVNFGESHPATPLGYGWNAIMTDLSGIGDYGGQGVIVQISGIPDGNATALTPQEGAYLDRQVDDGNPNSGGVTAEWSSSSDCDEDTGNTYREDLVTQECIVYFRLR